MGGSLHVLLGEVFRAAFAIQLFAATVLQLDTFSVGRTPPPTVLCRFLQTCMEEMSQVLSAFMPPFPSLTAAGRRLPGCGICLNPGFSSKLQHPHYFEQPACFISGRRGSAADNSRRVPCKVPKQ